jgi:hypothetical protein
VDAPHSQAPVSWLPRQRVQDELDSLGYAALWQNCHLVAERRICVDQALIFGDASVEAVTPFAVRHIDFQPGRSQESASVIAVGMPKRAECWLAGQVTKRDRSIDEAPVKEYPLALSSTCRFAVGMSERDATPGERNSVCPRERRATAP